MINFVDTPEVITAAKPKDIKETALTPEISSTGNHLGVPKPVENNPNLLSPEILNQRRGKYACSKTIAID